ncbi:MAG: hypothetical protein E7207_02090 [Clostridium butyricum]|nr:hypothetical protein [Clostridium butyricum]
MYIIAGVSIFIFVVKLFFGLLPWLVVFGGLVYLVSKIKSLIEKRKFNNTNNEAEYTSNAEQNVYENNLEDYTNGEVIDVDYEDVEKR